MTSIQSPQEILSRWNITEMGMQVHSWNISAILPAEIVSEISNPNTPQDARLILLKQALFYSKCLLLMKRLKRSWVALHDADEFITFNRFTPSDPNWKERNETLKRAAGRSESMSLADHLVLARTRLPEAGGAITVADFINREHDRAPWAYQPCLPMTRLLFGAAESPEVLSRDTETNVVPHGFNATNFDTLRYLQHRAKGSCSRNCKGKTMVDVSRIPNEHLVHSHYMVNKSIPFSTFSPHDPVLECNKTLVPSYLHSVLRVNHYLGSQEAFFAKGDPRRAAGTKFRWYNDLKSLPETEGRQWLAQFVERVGSKRAYALLKGAGEIEIQQAVGGNLLKGSQGAP